MLSHSDQKWLENSIGTAKQLKVTSYTLILGIKDNYPELADLLLQHLQLYDKLAQSLIELVKEQE